MKFSFIVSRKFLIALFCFILLSFLIFSTFCEAENIEKNGDTFLKRQTFLKELGCIIDENEWTKKQVAIPVEFSLVYENYNEIQKKANYDLSRYKGEKCTLYSYRVKEYADFDKDTYAYANLLIYKGRIIGGDISSTAIDGKMYPLKSYGKTKT